MGDLIQTTPLLQGLRHKYPDAQITLMVSSDLENAVSWADIISAATMSTEPLINGKRIKPGQHIDLIGAYRSDMREADDNTLQKSRIFVDSFDTTVDHIGELKIPVAQGVINKEDVIADFYDLKGFIRNSEDEITLFKNGGGAHLDLMTSHYILQTWLENNWLSLSCFCFFLYFCHYL